MAIAMVMMVICVNLRMTDSRRFFFTLVMQGTLHGSDKLQHRRGVPPLRSSDPQGCVEVGLQDWNLILKQSYLVEKNLP